MKEQQRDHHRLRQNLRLYCARQCLRNERAVGRPALVGLAMLAIVAAAYAAVVIIVA